MDILKAIAQAVLVKEAANVGSKYLHNKRITKNDEQSLGLAMLAYVFVNLPPVAQNGQLNS